MPASSWLQGKTDVLRLVLEAGASAVQKSIDGETPLHRAARLGRAECASELIVRGASGHRDVNRHSESALDVAGKMEVKGKVPL